jgi:hypothetical protein
MKEKEQVIDREKKRRNAPPQSEPELQDQPTTQHPDPV